MFVLKYESNRVALRLNIFGRTIFIKILLEIHVDCIQSALDYPSTSIQIREVAKKQIKEKYVIKSIDMVVVGVPSRYTSVTTAAVVPLLMYEVDQIVKLKSKDK